MQMPTFRLNFVRPQVGLERLHGLDYEHQWCLRETACGAPASSYGAQDLRGGALKTIGGGGVPPREIFTKFCMGKSFFFVWGHIM